MRMMTHSIWNLSSKLTSFSPTLKASFHPTRVTKTYINDPTRKKMMAIPTKKPVINQLATSMLEINIKMKNQYLKLKKSL